MPALLACFRRFGSLSIPGLAGALGVVAAVLPLAIWVGTYRRIGALWAAVVALAPFAVSTLAVHHYGAYADSWLTMAAVAGMLLTLIGIRDRDKSHLLAGSLALGACAALKNEGALWVLSVGAMLGLFALARGLPWKKAILPPIVAAVPAIVYFIAWSGVCKSLGLESDLLTRSSLGAIGGRLGIVLPAVWRQLVTGDWQTGLLDERLTWANWWRDSNLPLWLPAMLALPFVSQGPIRRRALSSLALLSGPAVYCAGICLVYLATPKPLEWHLGTSVARVLFLVPPAVVALVPLARLSRPPRETHER
jgi:hypothetical protein